MPEKFENNTVIKIDSIRKSFIPKLVLNNINLDINQGQSVCICGINGAGKSTLLRIVAGLLQPDKGSVYLNEYDITTEPEKTKLQLGVISHKSMVYPDLTVLENLSFFANLYGITDSEIHINKIVEDVGLSPYRYDRACVLSRGLLQRLAIARALVHQPAILLADEPFTGLDTEASQYLISVLNDFIKQGGTIVMTTHDINVAMRCCNRVIVLDKTKLIFDDLTDNLDMDVFKRDYLSYARDRK